jgi:tRNA nucleotidyltransferase/poly(A) polymerase
MKQIIRQIFIEESTSEKTPKPIRVKMDMFIPEDIKQIKDIFVKNGYKLYVVGGAVRDVILGKTPKDYDLATDALPDKVEEMMSKAGLKTLPTGKAFGVINVFTNQGEYEIATFREDIGSGRRPDAVSFTNIEGDVSRRDLTINALFYDIETGEVVDLVGGINDIKKGIVRTVGNANDRFGEDRLRILRAIRFAGRFGSELDKAIDTALQKDSNLEGISGERIRDEFIKGLASAKSTKQYLQLIDKYKLFDCVFNGLDINKRFIDNDDPIVLIAMLLHRNDLSGLAKKLNQLKYSSDEVKKITTLIAMLDLDIEIAPKLKDSFLKSGLSNDQLRNFGGNMGINSQLLDSFEEYLKLPKTTGQEAMEKYKIEKPGPELGKAINSMEIEKFQKLV